MLISATGDISDEALQGLAEDFEPIVHATVDERRMLFKSLEPPSWVALIDSPQMWATILGPTVVLFFSELVKEAAKDAWKNKLTVARVLSTPIIAPLRLIASAIARFRASARSTTHVDLGYPIPDEQFGTRLMTVGKDEETIAVELALFIRNSEAVSRLIDAIDDSDKPIGQISLELLEDGSMRVTWMGSRSFAHNTHVLPPPRG